MSWPTVRSPGGSGGGRSRIERLEQRRDGARRARRAPRRSASRRAASSNAFETARSSSAGTPAAAAARRTAKPSIASTSAQLRRRPTRALVAIGRTCAPGSAGAGRSRSSGSGSGALDPREGARRVDEVAVDRLRAEHERSGLEVARAGDADVEDAPGRVARERAGGRGAASTGPDPAAQRLGRRSTKRELELGGGDDEHRSDGRRARVCNAFVPDRVDVRADTGATPFLSVFSLDNSIERELQMNVELGAALSRSPPRCSRPRRASRSRRRSGGSSRRGGRPSAHATGWRAAQARRAAASARGTVRLGPAGSRRRGDRRAPKRRARPGRRGRRADRADGAARGRPGPPGRRGRPGRRAGRAAGPGRSDGARPAQAGAGRARGRGPAGADGRDRARPGPTGAQRRAAGATGAQGATGADRARRAPGATGATGPAGAQPAPPGATGAKGDAGPAGARAGRRRRARRAAGAGTGPKGDPGARSRRSTRSAGSHCAAPATLQIDYDPAATVTLTCVTARRRPAAAARLDPDQRDPDRDVRARPPTSSSSSSNAGTAPADIGGWKVVYRSAAGTSDTTLATIPTGTTLAAGALLPRSAAARTPGPRPPTSRSRPASPRRAARSGCATPPARSSTACGWGTATNALVEGSAAAAPPATAAPGSSIVRHPGRPRHERQRGRLHRHVDGDPEGGEPVTARRLCD